MNNNKFGQLSMENRRKHFEPLANNRAAAANGAKKVNTAANGAKPKVNTAANGANKVNTAANGANEAAAIANEAAANKAANMAAKAKANAATKIQAQLRGELNRKKVAAKRNAQVAATKIQAQFRGQKNRKKVANMAANKAANMAAKAMVDKFITNLNIQNNSTVNKNETNKLRKEIVQLIFKYYSITEIGENINKQISNANRKGSPDDKNAILKLLNNQGNTRKKLELYMKNKNQIKNENKNQINK